MKIKINLISITIFAQLFVFTISSHATAPGITSVAGTIQSGQTITITGSNMVNENTTNWDSFFSTQPNAYGFEGSSPTADGYLNPGGSSGAYVSDVKLMGSKSFRFHVGANSPPDDNNVADYYYYMMSQRTQDKWYRYYVRYNAASNKWFNNYAKQLYVMGSGNDYLDVSGTSDYSMPTSMYYWDGDPNKYGTLPSQMQNDRWYCVEVHFKSSSPAVTEVYIDGQRIINTTPTQLNKTPNYVLFGIPNAKSAPSGLSVYCWWDGLVDSTSRIYPAAKIEVSNNATYGAGTLIYQQPVYLSDGSIQVKLNLTELGNGPYYMWITNNKLERSSVYQLGSGTPNPAPIANFSATPQTGTLPLTVVFTDTSTNTPTSWAWDFNDDNIIDSTVQNPSYTYTSSGVYSITMTVTNAGGSNTITKSNYITVNDVYVAPTNATILFSENFDASPSISSGWYDNIDVEVSTSVRHSGTGSYQYHFLQGATTPISGGAMRKKFDASDSIYLSYYIKYSSNWTGSNQAYHPHQFYLLTNKNSDWSGLAYTYLTVYIEENEGRPQIVIQDGQNIDEANIGVDLSNVSESRSVAGCNGDCDGYGNGECYSVATNTHWNGKDWKAPAIYFSDTAGAYYKGDWHHVEAYIKLNSISGGKAVKDGVITYWYDGSQVMNYNNIVLRTGANADMKFNQFVIAPWIGDGSPVDQTFWIDDLTLATKRPLSLNKPTGVNIEYLP